MGSGSRGRGNAAGFTLVELLVVILIIAVLAALLTASVVVAKKQARVTAVKSDLTSFENALQSYYSDYNQYPGYTEKAEEDANSFWDLYERLLGERPPDGRAGKNAPYIDKYQKENVVVEMGLGEEGEGMFRPAERDELYDPSVKKYYWDPYGNPYIYRENLSKREKADWMINRARYDLWSIGPNGKDQSARNDFDSNKKVDSDGEKYDDLGNW